MWFLEAILKAGGADRYAQHAVCLTNDPLMVTLYIMGDLVTAFSYFFIGVTLLWRVHRSPTGTVSLDFSIHAAGLYGAFIFLCGLSHLTEVITLGWGIYRYDVMVTAAMAAVSATTAWVTTHEMSGRAYKRSR